MADSTGSRANQLRRTRKDLLQAAARLARQGRTPTLEECAEEAMVSRATATTSGSSSAGATSSRSRSGYGASQPTSAYDCRRVAPRDLARRASRQTWVAILYSHARTCSPSNVCRLRHARRNVSCTASSASSYDASIR